MIYVQCISFENLQHKECYYSLITAYISDEAF